MIIEQLLETDERMKGNSKSIIQWLRCSKKVQWTFLTKKLYNRRQGVVESQIKNQQNKKEIKKNDQLDVTKKIGATFNLNLSQEQKLMKKEIDNQINPQKGKHFFRKCPVDLLE
ncbi:unnamed protein product [Paramecium octaurelia]|uniref:Uncharacterized protein n=1 Tax=Paramecium octaurelia TaxID=43137 RepID=A0A8S1XHQ0_PAROT|nr:unnamed protein product [Paramecium octaurelia]